MYIGLPITKQTFDMKRLTFNIFRPIHFLLAFCCIGLFSSCGGDDAINYREKIIGEWELKNIGDLQASFKNKSFMKSYGGLKLGAFSKKIKNFGKEMFFFA